MSDKLRFEFECTGTTLTARDRAVYWGDGMTNEPLSVCLVSFVQCTEPFPDRRSVRYLEIETPAWGYEWFKIGHRYNLDVSEVRK